MTAMISAMVEAWSELRIHKTRVLLALIGVALSVAVLTTVVGVGNLAREGIRVDSERNGGREATLTVSVQTGQANAESPDSERTKQILDATIERYGFSHASQLLRTQARFQFPNGVQNVELQVVDPPYGTIHRVDVSEGAWFAADDAARLAPAVVVNEAFYSAAGRPNLVTEPQVSVLGSSPATAVIIGVMPNAYPQAMPQAFMLTEAAAAVGVGGDVTGMGQELRVWVPTEMAQQLVDVLTADLTQQLPGAYVGVYRSDYAAYGDPFAMVQIMVSGIAALILLLGAVGLLNISMVTVRYRVREIGIRRSFGATSGRIFTGVMMESVVGTTVAGAVGVMLAVAIVKNPFVESKVAPGLDVYPAFPVEAALLGLGAAVLVGALAGAIPALVAIRVKVIDAIRF
ncbi:putative ABC transport system permease protein [Arthrobacter alpinus]|uniref:Putative ABC transport system permease protein n=1 Tax=Arthrobacter alpinus TaxID=656366 RepID=A0A1H5KPL0_9MICC|nr:ABC transporter permease [Arthrobacter alpinus]SEE66809.1 putative ABC transport system permease protein [Arthrobacter alpinus]